MKNDPIEKKLEELSTLSEKEEGERQKVLEKLITSKSNLVIAGVARCAAKLQHHELINPMLMAFDRLMINPLKSDKQCHGKLAIIQALLDLEHQDSDVYLKAAQHVQMEPVYGGRADSAPRLRGLAGIALTRCMYPEVYFVLGELLMDSESETRSLAAQALSAQGDERAELLLRARVMMKESNPSNYGDYFKSLLQINKERSFPLVSSFLSSDDMDIWQEAVMALGESREADAFESLSEQWDLAVQSEQKKVLILAISLLRSDESLQFLCRIFQIGNQSELEAAAQVIGPYLNNEASKSRLKLSAEANDSPLAVEILSSFD